MNPMDFLFGRAPQPPKEVMEAHSVRVDPRTMEQIVDIPARPKRDEYKNSGKFTLGLEQWAADNDVKNRMAPKEGDEYSSHGFTHEQEEEMLQPEDLKHRLEDSGG